MEYGLDEDLGFLADEDDKNRRIDSGNLTDYEKMLCWLEIDSMEFNGLGNNEQANHKWQWRKFGRKEYEGVNA